MDRVDPFGWLPGSAAPAARRRLFERLRLEAAEPPPRAARGPGVPP
ncbi:MAG: hypothetical protein U0Z44_08455 [Kouleothrix sp.]